MNIYVIGIIFFIIVIIVCIFLLAYYTSDEKKLKEVSDKDLIQLGKVYSKSEFEDVMFNQYINILQSVQYANYSFLKDAVSDDVYNQILLAIKESRERNEENVITNIKKDFCRLISFDVINNMEVAKIWIRYSSVEYAKTIKNKIDQSSNEVGVEIIVKGDKDNAFCHEYILTFVKDQTQTENITCPACGYQEHLLKSSICIRCESEIVPKRKHWVFVGKIAPDINNK